jgi:hypothetical protein
MNKDDADSAIFKYPDDLFGFDGRWHYLELTYDGQNKTVKLKNTMKEREYEKYSIIIGLPRKSTLNPRQKYNLQWVFFRNMLLLRYYEIYHKYYKYSDLFYHDFKFR